MVTRAITIDEFVEHAPSLFEEHVAELGYPPLNVDHDAYRALDSIGATLFVGSFVDSRLVGYSVAVLSVHPHRGVFCGASTALFVSKCHRSHGRGIDLMLMTETLARQRGAKLMTWGARPGSKLDRILQRRAHVYTPREITYERDL